MINSHDQKPAFLLQFHWPKLPFGVLFLLAMASLFVTHSSAQDKNVALPNVTPTPTFSESAGFTPSIDVVREFERSKKKKSHNPKSSGDSSSVQKADVELQVLVIDATGKVVSGLKPADFSVLVDGSPHEILSISEDRQQSVIFALDTSTSTAYALGAMRAIVEREVALLHPDDKITIVDFSNDMRVLLESSSDRAAVQIALNKLEAREGGTTVYDSVAAILEKSIAASAGTPSVVLISDGIDTRSRIKPYKAMAGAWSSSVPFFVLYVDSFADNPPVPPKLTEAQAIISARINRNPLLINPNGSPLTTKDAARGKAFLMDISQSTGGLMFLFQPKSPAPANIGAFLHGRYTLTIPKPASASDGIHKIKVRVARPNLTVISKDVLVD